MMDNKEFSVIICGQITIDDLVLMDRPVLPDSPGGDGIYQLSGAYIWRRDKLGLIIRQGNDFDMNIMRDLTDGTVDFTGVVANPDVPNIHTFEMFDRKGYRYFINQRWSGQDSEMAPCGAADYPEKYRSTRAVSVAPIPFPWGREFLREMPIDDDTILLVDPHFDSVREHNRAAWDELFKKVTVWIPSEAEITDYFSIEAQDKVEDYIPYLKKVTDGGVKVAVVKLGARGALAYDSVSGHAWHVPTYAKTKVVDTTGCGDTFCGGFASGYVQSRDPLEGLICGSVAASFCIDHYGCIETFKVTREQAMARYEEFKADLDLDKCRLL
ncbi:MAG: PfkB family carbohydrate kinase [Oscillospiraceae bacterium]|nr:PfkB family carbohydrate kinase [Oscillospiraceae bacterium]